MGAILLKFALNKKQEIVDFYAVPGACKACYDFAIANSGNSSKLYEFSQCSGQSYELAGPNSSIQIPFDPKSNLLAKAPSPGAFKTWLFYDYSAVDGYYVMYAGVALAMGILFALVVLGAGLFLAYEEDTKTSVMLLICIAILTELLMMGYAPVAVLIAEYSLDSSNLCYSLNYSNELRAALYWIVVLALVFNSMSKIGAARNRDDELYRYIGLCCFILLSIPAFIIAIIMAAKSSSSGSAGSLALAYSIYGLISIFEPFIIAFLVLPCCKKLRDYRNG